MINSVDCLKQRINEWQDSRGESHAGYRVKMFEQMAAEREWPLESLSDWKKVMTEEAEFSVEVSAEEKPYADEIMANVRQIPT